MKKQGLPVLLIVILSCLGLHLQAQDTLPKFLAKNVGNNRIIISWTNTFQNIRQISIQRSFDSLLNYKTILSVPDPTTPQNGFLDTRAINDHMFYRLFILLDKGVYIFSEAKKPLPDTLNKQKKKSDTSHSQILTDTLKRLIRIGLDGKIEIIQGVDSVANLDLNLKNKNKPDVFVPSIYVSTYKNGYVHVSLPADDKKYSLKFFEDDGAFLFEIKDLKEKKFSIDKADFYHAGWFRFELYGDGKLIEKHKFYLEKEF